MISWKVPLLIWTPTECVDEVYNRRVTSEFSDNRRRFDDLLPIEEDGEEEWQMVRIDKAMRSIKVLIRKVRTRI